MYCDMVLRTPVSFIKLTVTISPAPCKIKLDASTFLFAILRGCRGLSRITVLPTNYNHNADIVIVSITPRTGPSIVNTILTIVGETYTR